MLVFFHWWHVLLPIPCEWLKKLLSKTSLSRSICFTLNTHVLCTHNAIYYTHNNWQGAVTKASELHPGEHHVLLQQQPKNALTSRKRKCLTFQHYSSQTVSRVVWGWSAIPVNLVRINFTTINATRVEKKEKRQEKPRKTWKGNMSRLCLSALVWEGECFSLRLSQIDAKINKLTTGYRWSNAIRS